jgi:hypothetical protein
MTPARALAVLGAVAEGTRVVVRTIDGVAAGRFLDATPAHVRLALRTGEARIALASVERIEVVRDGAGMRGRFSSAKEDDDDEGAT